MSDLLYSFCATWLSNKPADNLTTLTKCSHVFLIDGQSIPFARLLTDLAGQSKVADTDVMATSSTLGDDSIHYQQLRAYELARQLIESKATLTKKKRLKIAIVGGGFSGLTAALTLLEKSDDVDVTLFEHHHKILPRFAGAYGRTVHPYHHLRSPAQGSIEDKSDGDPRHTWHCPVRGGHELEEGGISSILSWKPGPIEKIIAQVKVAAENLLKKHDKSRLTQRFGVRVLDLEPSPTDGLSLAVSWVDSKVITKKGRGTLDQAEDELTLERFDAVILALGGMRDVATIPGQSNLDYWSPLRFETSAPASRRYEAAVIGAGNSAASEVFNLLLADRDFVKLLTHVQRWAADGHHPRLAAALAADATTISKEQFADLLQDDDWRALGETVERDLIGTSALYSGEMIRVSMFVTNLEGAGLFRSMNGVNRFLVLLLWRLNYVRLVNLYEKWPGRSPQVEKDYAVKYIGPGAFELRFKRHKIRPPEGRTWHYVLNCAGPRRFYQDAFASAPRRGDKYAGPYRLWIEDGTDTPVGALQQILTHKQRILNPERA